MPKEQKNPSKETKKDKYGGRALVKHVDGVYLLDDHLHGCLDSNKNFNKLFIDAVKTGRLRSNRYDSENQFKVGERYSRDDVCRLLNWERSIPGQNIGGYFVTDKNCPIFVTYNKSSDIFETINYKDKFYDPHTMHCYSKDKRKLDGAEMKKLFAGVNEGKPKIK